MGPALAEGLCGFEGGAIERESNMDSPAAEVFFVCVSFGGAFVGHCFPLSE